MALAALVAIVGGGCGGGAAAAVPDRFSGTWKLRDGGRPCGAEAVYFRATYFGGLAHLAGCATGDGRRMSERFDDNGRRGTIVQRLVREHPQTFVARIVGVGGMPFTVTATRVAP